ncbi:MAG: Uma2 family endonuclease, partial [Desertifilum sp. SIO1I2]|nr:Uma2 family endonuclease [Desertifilum sp. SIO1I2]
MVTLQLRQLDVPPGHRVQFHNVEWNAFEAILEELGEDRGTRIAYDNGILEIMNPLPEHESDKEIIGDLLKAFLEECDIEFLTLGSTTFKNPQTLKGIEPDQCFYIQNEASVRGKKRLDLSIDPPPDLALEIDITSRTHPATYAALGVPELWRRESDRIQIYTLQSGQYSEVEDSPTFSGWMLHTVIPTYLE